MSNVCPNPSLASALTGDLFRSRRAENRLAALVGLAGAALLHFAAWLAIPIDLFRVVPSSAAGEYQEYLIELEAAPAEPRASVGPGMIFTETSGEGEAVDPGPTNRFGVVSQSASSPAAVPSEEEATPEGIDRVGEPVVEETPITKEVVDPLRSPEPRVTEVAPSGTPINKTTPPRPTSPVAAVLGNGTETGGTQAWKQILEPRLDRVTLREPEPAAEPESEPVKTPFKTITEELADQLFKPLPEEPPAPSDEPETTLDGPLPRPRLETIPIGARRPILSDAARYGKSRIAVKQSPWGEYSKEMTDRIRSQFDGYLMDLPESDRGGHVRVHFTLRSDGTVDSFRVDALRGSEAFQRYCQQAVADSQPFGVWSSMLVNLYGDEHRVTYEFLYDGHDE